MSNTDKCRVCLSDGAKYLIFENIDSKDSVHSKLFQCLQEKIEDIEGYPRNICESCNDVLNTTVKFITNFRTSCKLLQSNISIKKEICDSVDEVIKEECEIELCKYEPETDWIESFDVSMSIKQLTETKKQDTSITDIKAKLKGLKEINFKRKSPQTNNKKTSKIASFYLGAKFDIIQESLKSSLVNEPIEVEPKRSSKTRKLVQQSLCDICGAFLRDKHALNNHIESKHFDSQRECPECKKVFDLDLHLKKHIKRIHGNKSLVCETCGKAYSVRGDLNTHIKLVHLKKRRKATKKFPCDMCDMTFFSNQGLTIHERSAHTGERPAKCTECDSCFFHEGYLKQHMRLHTGETPYKCPICSRGYAQGGNLRSHITHNHRLADLSPEIVKNLDPSWFKYLKKP